MPTPRKSHTQRRGVGLIQKVGMLKMLQKIASGFYRKGTYQKHKYTSYLDLSAIVKTSLRVYVSIPNTKKVSNWKCF